MCTLTTTLRPSPIILPVTTYNANVSSSSIIDRISDLPCNVIDGILKHLNIQELVSTSILSRKWRYMWTSVKYEHLSFDEDFFSRFEDLDDPDPEISRIITEVLFLHNGPIFSFVLDTPIFSNILITNEYLYKWILFLSRRGIKDLQLLNHGTFNGLPHMKMPSFVFSCQELTYFHFSGFNLSVPPNLCALKSLLVLHLECNRYELGSLESLIAGCPLLEKLSILLYRDMKSICLKNAKNLVDLSLTVKRERVAGFIKSLPKIQRLAIKSDSDKLYADIIHPSQLISLKYLKLKTMSMDDRREVLYIVSVLKSASNLVELDIQSNNYDGVEEPNQSEELECNSCCLSQLQTVHIRVGTKFKHAMSLIRFILANSSSLRTLTFEVAFGHKNFDAAILLNISQDLLRMERASQRAQVEFLHPKIDVQL